MLNFQYQYNVPLLVLSNVLMEDKNAADVGVDIYA